MKKSINTDKKKLIEQLAATEHTRWADWQRFVHNKCQESPDGEYVLLPMADYMRWERQIRTPYADLEDIEQQSDRDQVVRYLPVIKSFMLDLIHNSNRRSEIVRKVTEL